MLLIDEYLPEFHVSSYHQTLVSSPASTVFPSIWDLDLSESGVAGLLFAIRGMPRRALTLKGLLQDGFLVLDERSGEELLFGGAGRFWTRNGDFQALNPEDFKAFRQKGHVKLAVNFRVRPVNGNQTILSTETRVQCFGRHSRWRFGLYWFVIRPFSGLVRKEMLRILKKASEDRTVDG
jgi:hypothetical protein